MSSLSIVCKHEDETFLTELIEGDRTLIKLTIKCLNSEWGPDAEEELHKSVTYEVFHSLPLSEGFIAVWLNMSCTASFPEGLDVYWADKDCKRFRESEEISKNKRIVKYSHDGFRNEAKFILDEGFTRGTNISQEDIDEILHELESSSSDSSDSESANSEDS